MPGLTRLDSTRLDLDETIKRWSGFSAVCAYRCISQTFLPFNPHTVVDHFMCPGPPGNLSRMSRPTLWLCECLMYNITSRHLYPKKSEEKDVLLTKSHGNSPVSVIISKDYE